MVLKRGRGEMLWTSCCVSDLEFEIFRIEEHNSDDAEFLPWRFSWFVMGSLKSEVQAEMYGIGGRLICPILLNFLLSGILLFKFRSSPLLDSRLGRQAHTKGCGRGARDG